MKIKKIINPRWELPKEIVEKWEPVYEEPKPLYRKMSIGSPSREVSIFKDYISYIDSLTNTQYSFMKSEMVALGYKLEKSSALVNGLKLTPKMWIGCEDGTLVGKEDVENILKIMESL